MNRATIINSLLARTIGKSYLEVGTYACETFSRVVSDRKIGIDPNPVVSEARIKAITSDEFFVNNTDRFDVILIDGLHTAEQVYKDTKNAMNSIADDGYIVLHDLNPQKEEHQIIPYNGGHWNGDCWKAFVRLRAECSDYEFLTVDVDQGCGIIRKGTKETIFTYEEDLNWNNFVKNREKWLNLISWAEFNSTILENKLDSKLRAYIGDPECPENNWAMGLHYQSIGQTASAVSFFIRTAERTEDKLLQYESMIRAALCFMAQGTRGLSVRGLLHRAMTILPKRPEAYFLLARWWEREGQVESWVNCYSYASIAEQICDRDSVPLRTNVDYPGWYGLLFEKAVAGWWVGQCEESRDIFLHILKSYRMDGMHYASVVNNLRFMESNIGRKLLPEGIK